MATTPNTDDPIIPQGVTLREFDDTQAARKAIYDGTLEALKTRFPLENKSYRLELSNVRYTGPQEFTLAQQKHALLNDRNLHTPVTGHFKLFRKSDGALVDEKDEVVMHVPYYTDRGTIINNGSEYTVANQLRLRPGVYTRVRRSGDIETQFNVRPGTGRGFRLRMEPSTGVVTVSVGHANMPLYPLLKVLGVTDNQMIKAWGADVAYANAQKADSVSGRSAIDKLYQAFAGYNAEAQDLVSKEAYLKETLPKFALDPGVTSRTLGMAAEGVTPDVLLRASQKMFNVNRGEEEIDDRDNPGFANVYGIEDLYRERIEKDAGKLSRQIMMKISRAGSLKPVGRGAFSGWHHELLQGSGLAMPGDNSNPMALEEQMLRVTRLGEGGISSPDLLTDEARQMNPGNLNFIDMMAGPENGKIGADARLGVYTRKGSDGRLYSLFVNRQGRKEYVAADTASDSVIGFPAADPKAAEVPAMKHGKVQMVPRDEVDYFVPATAGMFSSSINLNPMPTSVQGGRQFYAAKFWAQYMPTVQGESPLVDSLMPDGKLTWREHYGRKLGTLKAPADGRVTKVTDGGVTVVDKDGKKHFVETVVDFPFNGLTGLTYRPTVKVGDEVKSGDMVAASNFVDPKTGSLAMGHNMRVAWIPYKGQSHEDALVMSESAAKKLATDRLYGFESDPRDGGELGLSKYMSSFPQKFTKEQYATLDDNGVVKEGTVLHRGDPISVAVGPKMLTAEDANLGKLSKVLRGAFTDKAQTWEHDYPGTVVSSTVFRGRAKVNVKAAPPLQVGDKASPGFALKGVVGHILPDDKMPRDAATNEPYDILMNPMGIPSRIAPGQLIETALGKLAKATGKQIRLPQDPPPEGWAAWAKAQLDAAGVKSTSDIFDPETGKTIRGVGDGYVYWHAMHHIADKKLSAKGGAGGYTADLQPAKGGPHGAKRNSGLDNWALLAHGATEVMKDIQTVRGTKNENYWKAVRSGGPLPAPEVPFIYQKAMNLLRAGGINVVEGQKATDILPMTDKDTDELTGGRVITNAKMLDNDMKEIPGGLFDPFMTGGSGNRSRWASIRLPEPIPNPVMEEPVRRVLGLTTKRLQAVISGEEQLNGKTGGAALLDALKAVDVEKEIANQREIVRKSRGSARDNAVKVLGYLDGCRKQGLEPKDWMVTKIPVIPPMFRPIARLGDTSLVSDINELYRDVIESSDSFRQLKKDVPDSGLTEERLNIYKAVKAAYGLGDPISPEGQAKGLKGAIRQVIGAGSPKCYSADTEILTLGRRWIPVTELSMEDTVATVRPDTYALEWQRPVDITHAAYSGKMVRIYSKKLDTLVTPNHKHFVEIRHGRGVNADFSHAEKVDAGKLLQVRSRWRMLTAPDGGQSGTVPRTDFGGIKFSSPEALARFLGMYVAEGWVPYRGEKSTQVTICQDSNSIHVPYIDGFCDGLGIEVSRAVYARKPDKFRKVSGQCIWWTVNDHTFAQWVLKNFGSGSENKHFSDEVLSWDARYLRLIVEAYMRGDGENNKGRIKTDRADLVTYKNKDALTVYGSRASTVSLALVDDMANLCMRIGLGFRVTDVMHYPDHREWRTKYRFRIDGWNKVVGGDSSVKTGEVDYDGTVHCCTVRNGLLVLRRKGMTFVSGNSGLWQAKVMSKAVDGVGRSVISPETSYDMDQCGIPEDAAWTLYKDYVTRAMVRRGYSQDQAVRLIGDRAPVAKSLLLEEMGRRPVILDRAPTWHKFNYMAFWPSLVSGSTMRMNPLVLKGFTADFDGDQMNFHVPASDKAVAEAIEKMMPSKNLISTTDLRTPRHVPSMEMTLGLAKLTAPASTAKPKVFITASDAIRAYRRGEIGANDPVSVLRH